MILQVEEETNPPQKDILRPLTEPDVLQPHNLCSYPETDPLDMSPAYHMDAFSVTLKM